jgi:hypothetical protein
VLGSRGPADPTESPRDASHAVIVANSAIIVFRELPYERMLAVTGGGCARTLQDARWLSTTPVGVTFPGWWVRWVEVVPVRRPRAHGAEAAARPEAPPEPAFFDAA